MLIDKFTDADDVIPSEIAVFVEEEFISLGVNGRFSGANSFLDKDKARRLIEALEQAISKAGGK